MELLNLTFDLEPHVRRDSNVKFAPLGSGPIHMMEMAPETAKRCRKEIPGETRRSMGFHRPSGSTPQVAAVSASFGCGPFGRQLRRGGLESRKASFTSASCIRPNGLTPFQPD
ncbi:hypothetical protein CHELA40_12838 [Chelatococcus asaccharovorans]|nr:hypothetical protein CHELA40_12838 [Chelatococcus asaccharovorans]CAH1681503.1 hypothetical protein CHELA17_62782 [Chelatococcus asaccharovorans]